MSWQQYTLFGFRGILITENSVIVNNSSPHQQSADCLLSVGWLLVVCRPTLGDLSADCWPTVGQLSTNTLPTVDRQIYLDFSEKINSCRTSVGQQSTDCWLTVSDLLVRRWQSVGRMLVTSCQLLPGKVYDLQPLIIVLKRKNGTLNSRWLFYVSSEQFLGNFSSNTLQFSVHSPFWIFNFVPIPFWTLHGLK